jgi:hypothetical protein
MYKEKVWALDKGRRPGRQKGRSEMVEGQFFVPTFRSDKGGHCQPSMYAHYSLLPYSSTSGNKPQLGIQNFCDVEAKQNLI